MSTTSTEELDLRDMQGLALGRDNCLDNLMDRHGGRLFRFLVRVLRNESEAEDVAQETFVRVYQHRQRFDSRYRFTSWLYRIATNLARDRLRRQQRRPEVRIQTGEPLDDEGHWDAHSDPRPDPGETAVASEAGQMVRKAVQALSDEFRIPLLLFEYDGLSHAEIGGVLGCTAKAVEMRLYRARQMLRKTLQPLLSDPQMDAD